MEKQGGGSSTGKNAPNVTAATLHDTRLDDEATKNEGIADDKLFTGEPNATDEWVPVSEEENSYTSKVTLTFTDVQRHQNKENNMGYWVGFFVEAPAGTKTAKYGFSETPDTPLEENAEQGIAFYFDAEKPKSTVCSVEFFGEVTNGEAPSLAKVVYTVDFQNVTIKKAEDPATPEMKVVLGENDATSLTATADVATSKITIAGKVTPDLFGEDGSKKPVVTITFAGESTAYTGTLTLAEDGKTATFKADEKDPAQELPAAYKDYTFVSDIKVETTEEPTSEMKLVSASYGIEGQKDPVALNFAFDKDDSKVINLTGKIDETLLADGKEVEGKLVYTLGSEDEQSYPFLLFFKDGKVDGKDKGEIKLPDGYTINYAGITTTKADEPVVEVPKEVKPVETPVTNVDAIHDDDKAAATTVVESVKPESTNGITEAAAAELKEIVAVEKPAAGKKVAVFLEVKATSYSETSVKLDITPKYEVVDENAAPTGKNAKELKVTKPVTLTVTLPDSFKDATNVFAKHLNANGSVKDTYKVTMTGTTGTFTTEGFSEFEFAKDERNVTVHYYGISLKEDLFFTVGYTAANIGSKHLVKHHNTNRTDEEQYIDKPLDKAGTFKGWSTKENDTKVEYEAGALITADIFTKMCDSATNGVLSLYPIFLEDSSTDKPNDTSKPSGGGGGSKRPSNNNNNTSTGTNPPSNYGDNPSNPSTPSTPASKTGFSDVVAGGWYEDAVQYMKDNGLMAGTSATTFAPDATTTRGMIVTILYRLEKEPAAAAASSFSDIAAGEWYSDAVAWAAANNIVSGYENGTFGAGDVITREQMAAILFRYASFKGYDVTKTADLSAFADAAQVSAYAADAMKWANAAGLISGTSATTLAPAGSATRAQAASILMRFCENVAK